MLIVALLHISVRVYFSAGRPGLKVRVKYLWLTLYSYSLDGWKKPSNSDTKKNSETPGDNDSPFTVTELYDSSKDDSAEPSANDSGDEASHEPSEKKAPDGDSDEDSGISPSDDAKAIDDGDNSGKDKKRKKSLSEILELIKLYLPTAKKALKRLRRLIRIRELDARLSVSGSDPHKAGIAFARANQLFYPALGWLCAAFSVTVKRTEITCDYYGGRLDGEASFTVLLRPSYAVHICFCALCGILWAGLKNRFKKKANGDNIKNNKKDGRENERETKQS